MRNLVGVGCFTVLVLLGTACDDDGTGAGMMGDGSPGDGAAPDGGLAACTQGGGNGNLTITITGLPADVPAGVSVVAGAAPPMAVTASQSIMVTAGRYTVGARRVAGPADPIARKAYEPSFTNVMETCVLAGQTVSVTVNHTLIATSNRLWLSNGNGTAAMLAFPPSALAATGMPATGVAAMTKSNAGFTFDAAGNLWALGSTTVDPPVARYPAASLATSGPKTPDITIDSPSFGGGSPGPKVLAFDRLGNLWSTVVWADKVVMFDFTQIASSGMPTAALEITGIEGPGGLAFDGDGNLWVTGGGKVMRIDNGRLRASGAGADLSIALQTPPPTVVNLGAGSGLAFDKDRNLWVEAGALVRLTPADLAGTGTKTVTPAVQIELDVTTLPVGLAFDESGGLWLAAQNGKFARFSAAQLGASGMPAPEVVITSADVGHADFFGIYPAPAALPLHHRLP